MLVQQGAERSADIDLRLACTLSAVAGALNASVLYVAGFFAANMTGNVSALSDDLALGLWGRAGFYGAIVAVFIVGAMTAAVLISAGLRHQRRGVFALVILFEAVVLSGLWVSWGALAVDDRLPVLVLGLSFAMGLQNATVTRLSSARVRTTHISGMATDIGIELGVFFDRLRGKPLTDEDRAWLSRLRLHSATILCFLLGGVAGVGVFQSIGSALWLACAAALAVFALSALLRLRRS